MATKAEKLPPVSNMLGACVDAKPRNFDFSDGYSETWDVAIQATEEEQDNDPDEWAPMMNYAYPLCPDRDAPSEEELRAAFAHLPLTAVTIDGEVFLALTGGGMDLSWEICEGYMRLGYLPPAHFADLPAMSGRGVSARDLWIVAGCRRSVEVQIGWAQRKLSSLTTLVHTAKKEARARTKRVALWARHYSGSLAPKRTVSRPRRGFRRTWCVGTGSGRTSATMGRRLGPRGQQGRHHDFSLRSRPSPRPSLMGGWRKTRDQKT